MSNQQLTNLFVETMVTVTNQFSVSHFKNGIINVYFSAISNNFDFLSVKTTSIIKSNSIRDC